MGNKFFMSILAGILSIMLVGWLEIARAENHSLDLICCSYHFFPENYTEGYNEINPGLLYKYYPTGEDFFFYGGIYKNSFGRTSSLGGVGNEWELSKNIDVSLSMGLVTGYENKINSPVLPQIVPAVTFYDRVTIMAIPAFKDSAVGLTVNIARW